MSKRDTIPARPQIAAEVARLASSLRRLHGGRWAVTIDHKARFVLIRQRLQRRAK